MLGQIMQPQAWCRRQTASIVLTRGPLLGHNHFNHACRRAGADAGAVQLAEPAKSISVRPCLSSAHLRNLLTPYRRWIASLGCSLCTMNKSTQPSRTIVMR